MTEVIFGSYNFDIEATPDGNFIFDILRKKNVALTPEEWVRQNIVHYLISTKNYSKNLLAVERGIEINGLTKRFDIVAFNRNGKPFLMVECKAENIELSPKVLNQILVYNQSLSVRYLWITNGGQNFCYDTQNGLKLLAEIPNPEID
ncbi:MAG: type I restriction enzyme HsdR N-terminal domain-containing protein [Chitinophagales bacterium]|nr:type I restriction enzyme HsdR N-terminal domain-containing protein [Chitinophagales bacterium]MCO5281693.1 type I restriction enzyme HsdR N-terminal domain-containing protein [Chitinophagales bacterium]OJV30763.1 MAG: hypothetical protein BGO32_09710 [Bacteroidetes bacterium 37-13]HRN93566.1 type I restriction enzyme HsdR N-terminal domain-containing protein [Chitinophagales bacterium]HRP40265.1 type I restriction enzyme HsdR N-terminal domain-containing protein [Chitinophagales bacterium]